MAGQQAVSQVKTRATQAWQLEFDPPNSYGGTRRELTPQDSSLTHTTQMP